MKTNIAINDDRVAPVKAIASTQHKPSPVVISKPTRLALDPLQAATHKRNGVPLLPVVSGGNPITSELIHRLMDELVE